jgi:hypothetical protein
MCSRNEKEKGEKIIQGFCIEDKGQQRRGAKLWGIKLAFLCAQAGWMNNILLSSLSSVFLCKPYFFILPPTQTTHKQKFAFVM